MRFGIHTLDDFDVAGKTVLLRADLNQPVDRKTGKLKSINRIAACVPTVKELSEKGAKTVILAHQGSDIEYQNYWTTAPHAEVLSELLGRPVQFLDDVCGPAAREKIAALQPGEILLLDNVRFVAEEQTLFEKKLALTHEQQAQTLLVRKLAPLGDLFVCDAFAAAHRDQPSLCGFEQVLPCAMGRLFEKEYCVISGLMESPARPCIFILGGAKIADAFAMMKTVLDRKIADRVLTGGLVANIFLIAADKDVGSGSEAFIRKSGYWEFVAAAKALLAAYSEKIVLPSDLAFVQDGARVTAQPGLCPSGGSAVDIGEETIEQYVQLIRSAGTAFVNGPMGVFENDVTAYGTKAVWEALALPEVYSVVGGGDSITAAEKFGVKEKLSYVCTGGGALIRFLSGEELPVVKALREGAERTVPAWFEKEM